MCVCVCTIKLILKIIETKEETTENKQNFEC